VPLALAQIVLVVGFACTVGAFAATLGGLTKSKLLYVAMLTAFVAVGVAAIGLALQQEQHSKHVEQISERVAVAIGKGQKTADEVLSELYPEDYGTVSEALGVLLQRGTVGNTVVNMRDQAGLGHNVRVYFVKQ
jgi:hypothetical protein